MTRTCTCVQAGVVSCLVLSCLVLCVYVQFLVVYSPTHCARSLFSNGVPLLNAVCNRCLVVLFRFGLPCVRDLHACVVALFVSSFANAQSWPRAVDGESILKGHTPHAPTRFFIDCVFSACLCVWLFWFVLLCGVDAEGRLL